MGNCIGSDSTELNSLNRWFVEPFVVADNSVAGIIETLNRHPIADDQTAQDYVMPTRRRREHAGHFRIYGENQDVYYCFVYDGDESKIDPPVYFESCLDLKDDYGIDSFRIIANDHVLVANRFTDFLWQMLGHHICLRMESSGQFSENVNGVVFDDDVELDDSFVNPLGIEFPAGYTCFVTDDVILIPDWGTAFLSAQARESFMARFSPDVSCEWA